MNSIRNGLGMRKTGDREGPGQPENPHFNALFTQVHNTLYLELPMWDKPALACLSSRFPYGQEITPEKLSQIARAEEFLRSRGFSQVRVRHHGEIARLEVGPEEMEWAFTERKEIVVELKSVGFLYVVLDLAGYRSGSLNAALNRNLLPILEVQDKS